MASFHQETRTHYVRPRKLENKTKFVFDPEEIVTSADNHQSNAQRRLSRRHHDTGEGETSNRQAAGQSRSAPPTSSVQDRLNRRGDKREVRYELIPGVKVKHAPEVLNNNQFTLPSSQRQETRAVTAANAGIRDAARGKILAQKQQIKPAYQDDAILSNKYRSTGCIDGVTALQDTRSRSTAGRQRKEELCQEDSASRRVNQKPAGLAKMNDARKYGSSDMRAIGCSYPGEVIPPRSQGDRYFDCEGSGARTRTPGGDYYQVWDANQNSVISIRDLREKLDSNEKLRQAGIKPICELKQKFNDMMMRRQEEKNIKMFEDLNIQSDEEMNNNEGNFMKITNTSDCVCLRPLKIVTCENCENAAIGRIMMQCEVHPEDTYLLDITSCKKCRCLHLTEEDIPSQLDLSELKENILIGRHVNL